MHKHHSFIFALLSVAVGTACQSPAHKGFESVQEGMEKDLVIESAGGPSKARRWNGKDRWIYEYPSHPDGPQTREVHFQSGKAVYIGNQVTPPVSAEEQDRLNQQANEDATRREREAQEKWERDRGVARTSSATPQSQPLDDQDRRLMYQYYGVESPEHEANKIAPTFEVVD